MTELRIQAGLDYYYMVMIIWSCLCYVRLVSDEFESGGRWKKKIWMPWGKINELMTFYGCFRPGGRWMTGFWWLYDLHKHVMRCRCQQPREWRKEITFRHAAILSALSALGVEKKSFRYLNFLMEKYYYQQVFFFFNISSSIAGTASTQRWNVNLVQLKMNETETDSLAWMRDVFTFFGKMWNYFFLLFSLFIIFY